MSGTTPETVEEALARILEKREVLRKELGQVEDDMAACQKVIALIRPPVETTGAQPEGEGRQSWANGGDITADGLRGLDIEGALIQIAEANEGVVLSHLARPVLTEAGLIRGDRRATSSRLYEALVQSECFESLPKRGRWRLLPEKAAERKRMEELGSQDPVF